MIVAISILTIGSKMKKTLLILAILVTTLVYAQKPKADAYRYAELTSTEINTFNVPENEVWVVRNSTTDKFMFWNGTAWQELIPEVDLSQYLTETESDGRYALISHVHAISDITGLQSSLDSKLTTETDPKRVTALDITGTGTKTVTLTLADGSNVSDTFTDLSGGSGGSDGNDFLENGSFNTSNGELTLETTNQTDVVVDLDGRYLTSFTEIDGSITNEIQTLSKSGNIITLSNGGGSITDTDTDTQLTESQVDSYVANNGYLTSFSETDPTIPSHVKSITTANITSWDNKENAFTKNTAFNKNFGTGSGTVAQGNDSRINNGQTAFSWGNHATQGYLTSEVDGSTTNEIQVLGTTSSTVTLTNGGGSVNRSGIDTRTIFPTNTENVSGLNSYNGFDSRYLSLTGGIVTGNVNVDGYANFTQKAEIGGGGMVLRLNGSNTGVSNVNYIGFYENSNTRQGYIGFPTSSNSSLYIRNDIENSIIGLTSGFNGLLFNYGDGNRTIWHSGNDGSGSGLDADLLDGLNATTTATANTIVQRDASGSAIATSFKTGNWEIIGNGAVLQFKYNGVTKFEMNSDGTLEAVTNFKLGL